MFASSYYDADPLAEAFVEEVYVRQGAKAGREMLDQALAHGIASVESAPPSLVRLFEDIERDPDWLEPAQLERGARVFRRYGTAIFRFAGAITLEGYSESSVAKPLALTGGYAGASTRRRFLETAAFWIAVAKDIMRTPILDVGEDASLGEAAAKMLHNQVHRLFVSRGDRIVGVFSTRDALRVAFFRRIETPLSGMMTAPVETILLGDSIEDALAKLEETNRRGLVVLDGRSPVGIFTQLEAIRARALSPELRRNPVEEMMSYESLSLDGATPLYRAAAQMIATRVRRILVVEGRTLVGIVSGYDLARILV